MNIISIINHKGGVGKTTTTLNLGSSLAHKGCKVLLLDLDGQANLTVSAGIKDVSRTIYEAFRDELNTLPILINEAGLEIVPASLDLQALEAELIGEPARELILKELLEPVKNQYDYILIDCPPALGFLTLNALTASDHIIIPVEAEALALKGMTKLLQVIQKVQKRLNPDIKVLGILVTKYDSRKVLNRSVHDNISQQYANLLLKTVIRDNVSIAEAPSAQTDIIHYAPKSYGAEDYLKLADEVNELLQNSKQ